MPPKTASATYQKLSQLEHVLKRPDSYIGSVEFHEQEMWVCREDGQMQYRQVSIVPGLYKIFDEILVNAADNKVRDPAMKSIKVTIDPANFEISVTNDGKGIPIEMHDKEKVYIPELIFGHLLTSSNYDDNEQKVTGGRNGFGAKLCNIFSREFILETADKKQVYHQRWTDNMNKVEEPQFSKNATGKSYTMIKFRPDLARFGMENFNDDIIDVLRRRVYDMAGTTKGVTVELNGNAIPITDFKAYVNMFLNRGENTPSKVIYYKQPGNDSRWEIAFAVSDGNFRQMSFVNSIATTSGGSHVTHVLDQITTHAVEQMAKRNKGKAGKLTKQHVRNHVFLFINCKINNPSFSSQTKEQLTSKVSAFGSRCELSEKFMKDVMNQTDLTDRLLEQSERQADKEMKKLDGGGRKRRLTGYSNLADANKAGTRESHKCTLIICEGESAKGSAVVGLEIVGRDYYGCFPIRGKMLNVREASHDQIMKNAEIQALKQIIGLQHKKHYTSTEGLRYGHIMIMTDQDHDGSHIKGLIINFLESLFPGLLDIPGFLLEFITPIVRVEVLRGKSVVDTHIFFSMPEYENWRETEGKKCKWRQKYFKGLGTSEATDMKRYFGDLPRHEKTFLNLQSGDKERIELAFSKYRADDRKQWLQEFVPGTFLDASINPIPINQFIDKELILFSMADNARSIPSVMDGWKPGQRKIMWVCFNWVRGTETKLTTLGGTTIAKAAYHHGDASLYTTTVGLAQDFIGSNNVYWLLPKGNFGSRLDGGKHPASARYISTMLNKISRFAFRKEDDPLLNYVQEDESTVEPEYYVPILPTVLVNGTEGIGTGWSSTIPSYNPMDLVKNLRLMMEGQAIQPMTPWYRGWTGLVDKIPNTEHQWRICGRIEEVDDNTLVITEIPIKAWIEPMNAFLEQFLINTPRDKDKKAGTEFIEDIIQDHSDNIRFVIKLSKEEMAKTHEIGPYNRFKLIAPMSTANMVAFDPQGRLRRYDSAEEILREFYHIRLDFYQKRKDAMVNALRWDLERLSARARFIKMIIENSLTVSNKRKKVLEEELRSLKFPLFVGNGGKPTFPEEIKPEVADEEGEAEENATGDAVEDEEGDLDELGAGALKVQNVATPTYDYLVNMHIASLTRERYQRIIKERDDAEETLNELLKKTIKDLWSSDLEEFETAYATFMDEDLSKRQSDVVKPTGGRNKRSRTSNNDDSDDDDDDDDYGKPKKRRRKAAPKSRSFAQVDAIPLDPPPVEEYSRKKTPARRVKSEPKEAKGTKVKKEVKKESSATKPAAAKPRKTKVKKEEEDIKEESPEPDGAATPTSRTPRKKRVAAPQQLGSSANEDDSSQPDDDSDFALSD